MTAPYWLDYLTRERTMCSICHASGLRIRIGDPIPPDIQRPRRLAAFRTSQRAAFRAHVATEHPALRVRWNR